MFKFRYGSECDNSKPCMFNKGQARIDSIIQVSKVYRDDLHVELEHQIEEDENLTVYFHRNCVSRYTSSTNTVRHTVDLLSMTLRPSNFVVLKHHLTFSLSACIVEINVTCLRTQNSQTGGEPSFVDQQCRSKTRNPTMNAA